MICLHGNLTTSSAEMILAEFEIEKDIYTFYISVDYYELCFQLTAKELKLIT